MQISVSSPSPSDKMQRWAGTVRVGVGPYSFASSVKCRNAQKATKKVISDVGHCSQVAVVVAACVEEFYNEMIEEISSDLDSDYWFLKAGPTLENGGDSAMEFEP
ncbi:hypothetical protein L2E82_38037 [Cichorium intybus]|uniref:Uncharacterized protein n=1 Tax=Cichorium intybus TaxID=13427 RepID=A0ACB9AFR8_CICIN|nr:hypothetical protein L2E82_38037 [Cichorium intybus]